MKTEFNWLTGKSGTAQIKILAEDLYNKIKAVTELELNEKYDIYSPWMSYQGRRVELKHLFMIQSQEVAVDSELRKATVPLLKEMHEKMQTARQANENHSGEEVFTSEQGINEIKANFLAGKTLYTECNEIFSGRYGSVIKTIIPMQVSTRYGSTNRAAMSSHLLRGAVFRAIPDLSDEFWRLNLAVDLAHELGHQALMIYQAADPIIDGELSDLVYSGVRKTGRPAIMSLHAASALLYMVEFLRCVTKKQEYLTAREMAHALAELTLYESDLKIGVEALSKIQFTNFGRSLYEEFENFCKLG